MKPEARSKRIARTVAWYLPALLFGAALAARANTAVRIEPIRPPTRAPFGISAEVTRAMFDALRQSADAGCSFEGIEVQGNVAQVRWSRNGVVLPTARAEGEVRVALTVVEYGLAVTIPAETRAACPTAARRLDQISREPSVRRRLPSLPRPLGPIRVPLRIAKLAWFAAALALTWLVRVTLNGLDTPAE